MEYVVSNGQKINAADVIDIAEAASDVILRVYGRAETEWGVEYKEGNEPLTVADKEANDVICQGLKRIAPAIPIISEECDIIEFSTRKNFEHFWCVDPLDGTKEFLQRNGQFTVNIALCHKQTPIMGIVTIPVEGKAYYAVEGCGAFRRTSRSSPFERIFAANFSEDSEGLVVIGSRNHNTPLTTEFIARYKSPKFLTMGSSLKLLLVAEGTAHVYPRLAPTREWDICASHAIVNEAGGCVVQLEGVPPEEVGKPVVYNKEDLLNPYFVVYGARRP